MQLKLADAGAVLRPVTAVVYARGQFVDQQTFRSDETLHRHHADVTQILHDGRKHGFGLRLLSGVSAWEGDAGAQNTILMQVTRQRVEYRAAVMCACANERHFTREINALLNNAFAVVVVRQLIGFTGA